VNKWLLFLKLHQMEMIMNRRVFDIQIQDQTAIRNPAGEKKEFDPKLFHSRERVQLSRKREEPNVLTTDMATDEEKSAECRCVIL